MKVYHSGNFWGHRQNGEKELEAISLNKAFEWEGLSGVIPAVYTGEDGLVIDLCIRIPGDEVRAFMDKWQKRAEEGALTDEETERLTRENPFAISFLLDMKVNGETLSPSGGCGCCFNPVIAEQQAAMEEEKAAKYREEHEPAMEADMVSARRTASPEAELADAYGCDRSFGWYFMRKAYDWPGTKMQYEKDAERIVGERKIPGKEIKKLRTLELCFQAERTAFAAKPFSTEALEGKYRLCNGEQERISQNGKMHEITLENPHTGKAVHLLVYGCEQKQIEEEVFRDKEREYPTHYQTLSYSTMPELSGMEFGIKDCAKGDSPVINSRMDNEGKKAAGAVSVIGGADGPTAVFIMGKSGTEPEKYSAYSALHFDAVSEVCWKPVFYEKERADMTVTIEL